LDPDTETYSVNPNDPALYPPGVYVIEICGTSGTESGCESFTITVIDPCTIANLSLARQILKASDNHKVGDPPATQSWSSLDLLVTDRVYDCGAPTFVLTKPNADPFDTTLFADNRDVLAVADDNDFVCLTTNDLNDVGTYDFQVKAYFANYPEVNTLSDVYVVNILDPCNPPNITKPVDQTVTYTISDVDAVLDLSGQFSITPDFCPTSVVYTNTNTPTVTNFEWDGALETFKIPQFFDSLAIMDGEKA